jgi:biopolymer transport protein ExbD
MRGRNRSDAAMAEVSMTPMLDIVFILLIFFIVTSAFTQEHAIKLEPPAVGGGDSAGRAMLIEINQDSVVRVNGRATDISAVRGAIERVKAEDPEIQIAIQVAPKAKTGVITLVRDAAYAAGYTEGVSLALTTRAL